MAEKITFKKKSKKSLRNNSGILGSGGTSTGNHPSILLSAPASNGVSAPSNSGGGVGSGVHGMPDGVRAKLLDLFSQIELQFEVMYGDNSACKFCRHAFFCCI